MKITAQQLRLLIQETAEKWPANPARGLDAAYGEISHLFTELLTSEAWDVLAKIESHGVIELRSIIQRAHDRFEAMIENAADSM